MGLFQADTMRELLEVQKEILKELREIKNKDSIKNIDLNIENMNIATGETSTGGTVVIGFDEEDAQKIVNSVQEAKQKERESLRRAWK